MVSVSPGASAPRLKFRNVSLWPNDWGGCSIHGSPTTLTPVSGRIMVLVAVV